MRRVQIAAVLFLIAVAGCGDDTPASAGSKAATARAEIAKTVRSYLDAYMHGRGAEACEHFTGRLRTADERKAKRHGFPGGCAQVMSEVGTELVRRVPRAQRRRFLDITINGRVDARLAGDRALASLTQRGFEHPQPNLIELRREGGSWLIDRLAVSSGEPWP